MTFNKKFLALSLSTIIAASLLTGCGTQNAASSEQKATSGKENTAEQASSNAAAANISDYAGSSFSGRVTAINSNEITLSIGGGPMGNGGERPDRFNKSENGDRPAPPDMNSDSGNLQTPPDMNSNDNERPTPPDMNSDSSSSQTPPDMNSNDSERPAPPDMNSDNDAQQSDRSDNTDNRSSDSSNKKGNRNGNEKKHESKTITITIDDESVLDGLSISDIKDGTRLTVSVDDNGSISKITQASDNNRPDKSSKNKNNTDKTNSDNSL